MQGRRPEHDSAAEFWRKNAPRLIRSGSFWIAGERIRAEGQTYQSGPLFAEWEAPEQVTHPWPLVLVHGGGYQGTEWRETPDGRPGWSQRLVEAGYAIVLVDRPGQGRSPFHPLTMGEMGPPFSYETGRKIYFPPEAVGHTQWPFDADDADKMDEFIAGYGPLPADLAYSEDMESDRLAKLLDRIGPAVLLTHSASGPVGWLVADRRPNLVKAIVAIEPMGPPFADIPNIGRLAWGLTASPLSYMPPLSSPDDVKNAVAETIKLPSLVGLPIAAVIGETSAFAPASPPIVKMLKDAGAAAELIRLTDHGIVGNGHGLIYEKNSDETLKPVLDWLARIEVTA